MKKSTIFLLLLIFCINGIAQKTYYPNGQIKEETDPYTHLTINYYENGSVKSKYKYIKPTGYEGEVIFYTTDGHIQYSGTYNNGKKEGLHKELFETGVVITTTYFDDIQNGEQIEYYKNGKIHRRIYFAQGRETGESVSYFENGQIESIKNSKNGVFNGEHKTFFENGELKSRLYYQDGLLNGEATIYYKNGHAERIIPFKMDKEEGVSYMFYEDGKLRMKGSWKNGEKVGTWHTYQTDGVTIIGTDNFTKNYVVESSNAKLKNVATPNQNSNQLYNSPQPTAKKKYKTAIKVDPYDFLDYPQKYIGKTVTLTVFYSSDNQKIISQPESMQNSSEMYYDQICQCLQPKNPYGKVGSHAVHWKKFIEINNVSTITVNIPKAFFMNNKIPDNFGKGHLDIDIDVYSGESRGSEENGNYSENRNGVNYELVNIRRHK